MFSKSISSPKEFALLLGASLRLHLESASGAFLPILQRSFCAKQFLLVFFVDMAILIHMSTQKDIAQAANVSVSTVSRVLAGKAKEARISQELTDRITEIAEEMRFRPSAGAKAIRLGQTRQVGVLVRNSREENLRYLAAYELILGINDRLEEEDYLLSIIRLEDIKECCGYMPRVFREKVLDGMIVIDAMPAVVEQRVQDMIPKCIWLESSVWKDDCCLHRDEVYTGYLAASTLIQQGFKKILWFGLVEGSEPHFSLIDRLKGVRKAASEKAVPVSMTLASLRDKPNEWSFDADMVDIDVGVVAYTSTYAQRFVNEAAKYGLSPGRNFGLISCDESAMDAASWPGLSRVTFDRYTAGKRAASMLISVLHDSKSICVSRTFKGDMCLGNTHFIDIA